MLQEGLGIQRRPGLQTEEWLRVSSSKWDHREGESLTPHHASYLWLVLLLNHGYPPACLPAHPGGENSQLRPLSSWGGQLSFLACPGEQALWGHAG